jgi:hypothetical protein
LHFLIVVVVEVRVVEARSVRSSIDVQGKEDARGLSKKLAWLNFRHGVL